ncbi:hypothetical protein N2152v2_008358 [Parachlorella kessleri]
MVFTKRKNGIFRRGMELSVLCDCDVAIIVYDTRGRLYQYSSAGMNDMLTRYSRTCTQPHEAHSTEELYQRYLLSKLGWGDEEGAGACPASRKRRRRSLPYILAAAAAAAEREAAEEGHGAGADGHDLDGEPSPSTPLQAGDSEGPADMDATNGVDAEQQEDPLLTPRSAQAYERIVREFDRLTKQVERDMEIERALDAKLSSVELRQHEEDERQERALRDLGSLACPAATASEAAEAAASLRQPQQAGPEAAPIPTGMVPSSIEAAPLAKPSSIQPQPQLLSASPPRQQDGVGALPKAVAEAATPPGAPRMTPQICPAAPRAIPLLGLPPEAPPAPGGTTAPSQGVPGLGQHLGLPPIQPHQQQQQQQPLRVFTGQPLAVPASRLALGLAQQQATLPPGSTTSQRPAVRAGQAGSAPAALAGLQLAAQQAQQAARGVPAASGGPPTPPLGTLFALPFPAGAARAPGARAPLRPPAGPMLFQLAQPQAAQQQQQQQLNMGAAAAAAAAAGAMRGLAAAAGGDRSGVSPTTPTLALKLPSMASAAAGAPVSGAAVGLIPAQFMQQMQQAMQAQGFPPGSFFLRPVLAGAPTISQGQPALASLHMPAGSNAPAGQPRVLLQLRPAQQAAAGGGASAAMVLPVAAASGMAGPLAGRPLRLPQQPAAPAAAASAASAGPAAVSANIHIPSSSAGAGGGGGGTGSTAAPAMPQATNIWPAASTSNAWPGSSSGPAAVMRVQQVFAPAADLAHRTVPGVGLAVQPGGQALGLEAGGSSAPSEARHQLGSLASQTPAAAAAAAPQGAVLPSQLCGSMGLAVGQQQQQHTTAAAVGLPPAPSNPACPVPAGGPAAAGGLGSSLVGALPHHPPPPVCPAPSATSQPLLAQQALATAGSPAVPLLGLAPLGAQAAAIGMAAAAGSRGQQPPHGVPFLNGQQEQEQLQRQRQEAVKGQQPVLGCRKSLAVLAGSSWEVQEGGGLPSLGPLVSEQAVVQVPA